MNIRLFCSIFFLSLFVWGMCLHIIWQTDYLNLQYAHRNVAEMESRGRVFTPMEFPSDEITWLKPHEISWKGEKFDIKKVRIDGEITYADAYRDHKENELEKKVADSQTSQTEKNRQQVYSFYYISANHTWTEISGELPLLATLPSNHLYSAPCIPGVFVPPSYL